MAIHDNEKTWSPVNCGLLSTISAHVHMCEEMDVQLYKLALALSVMSERGGTFMTEDDKQNAHRQAVAMRFIRACGNDEYLQHLRNSFLDGKDIYPKKISDAFTIMDQRIPTRGLHTHQL